MSVRVDTFGWDIAVGIPLPIANAALARSGDRLITAFDFTGEDMGQAYRLQGTFGAWSVLGGAGELIDLALPIQTGVFSLPAAGPLPAASHALDGAIVRLRTRLHFAEPDADSGAVSLLFSFNELAPGEAPDDAVGAARLVGGPTLSPEAASILPQAVAACLAHHFAAVRFVFATFTPHADLPVPLHPARAHSAYLAHCPADGPGALIVLWATDRQDAAGAALPPPPPLVPEAMRIVPDHATVALSAELAVGHVLRAALARGWERAQDDDTLSIAPATFDCQVDADGTTWLHASTPIDAVIEVEGKRYGLRAKSLTLQAQGDYVTLSYHLGFKPLFFPSGIITQSYLARIGGHGRFGLMTPGLTLEPTAETISLGAGTEPISLLDLKLRAGAWAEAFMRAARVPERLKYAFQLVPVPLGITLFDQAALVPQAGYLNSGILFQSVIATPAADNAGLAPAA